MRVSQVFGNALVALVATLAAKPSTAQEAAGLELERIREGASAEDVQRAFYMGFIENGVPVSIAALLTVDTTIVEHDDNHLRFVQTMIGGGRREVEVTVQSAAASTDAKVPFGLEDGTVGLVERVNIGGNDNGYRTTSAVVVPPESLTPELLGAASSGHGLQWLELLGISTALAQPPGSGLLVTMSDSYSGSGSSQLSMETMIQDASNLASSVGSDLPRLAQDVSSALQPTVEGPRTLWQHRADVARRGAKVVDHAGKVAKMLAEHDALEAQLNALQDCADNPTAPTARDAQRNDPNYRRATTDVINRARADLKMNTAIRILAATVNGGASVLLGSRRGSAVSALGKIEDKLLKHVAEKYIMADAGKGVVPCTPDCGPVYSPEPQPEELASYPPAELTCSTAVPEQLTCEAAPASSGPNFSQGPVPSPANPPPPSPRCVVLTSAQFTFNFDRESSGCGGGVCAEETESRHFSGTATLSFSDSSYEGSGTGTYSESSTGTETARVCTQQRTSSRAGSPAFTIDVLASLDNDVIGGIDASALPVDTGVAEVLVEGPTSDIASSTGTCYTPSESSNDNSVNFDCQFFGVFPYRPGFYRAYKSGVPESGLCTLTLR